MSTFDNKKIVILEMANNHMGDVAHGIKLIQAFAKICEKYNGIEFIFKLQFRDLETFIHPAYKERIDLKFIKRFEETRLNDDQFKQLIYEMRRCGFKTMATPFDEVSVGKITEFGLDYLKIASASFGDWLLMEEVASVDIPIVASTAGVALDVIDNVVSFFQHREKDFALMHCIGEYPTPKEKMNLNQIDFLKKRYAPTPVGLSTHEDPENVDLVKMAVAKGTMIFEKHVGLPTDGYGINAYSVTPAQFDAWLESMQEAFTICGVLGERILNNKEELHTLHALKRGVYAKRDLHVGETISSKDVYMAFPPEEGQLTANDWTKYQTFTLQNPVKKDEAILKNTLKVTKTRQKVLESTKKVKQLLKAAHINVPNGSELELSHHYGIDKFDRYGISMITVVNRDYCKKLIVVLPGQQHPEQYHKQKEETFFVLHGEIELKLDGKERMCKVGDVITIEPGVHHAFSSKNGAVIEEISSTHFKDDSYYTDTTIVKNKNRKTFVSFWMDA